MVFCCLFAAKGRSAAYAGHELPMGKREYLIGSSMLLLAHYCGLLLMPLMIGKLAALADPTAMLLPAAASLIGAPFLLNL